jgi:Na+-transporting NADH:ubiquinone oxidoreductase subunit C
MSNGGKIKKRIFPVIFMLLITLVFISVTSVIYTFTKDTIKFQESLRLKRAVLNSAGITIPGQPEELDKLYQKRVQEVTDDKGKLIYYNIYNEGHSSVISHVIVTTGAGLWGEITLAVGYDRDGKVITGIEVIDQSETPGLGGRITEGWFKKQFRGKQAPLSFVPEGETAGPNQFQAITGATYSTTAIMDSVNNTSKVIMSLLKDKEQ